jgi:hypothetical protein
MYNTTVHFACNQAIIARNSPNVKDTKGVFNAITHHTSQTQRFGLFEAGTPNFQTYYPDVTPEDLEPSESEYIYPLFRALSEVIIDKWTPYDFSTPGVLKASLDLLVGQTVYVNHDMVIGNEVGVVEACEYQEAYIATGPDGKEIMVPGGINARFKIDGKSNPKTARGIMSTPPTIHSVSVTVNFDWIPSHGMPIDEFYEKLGQVGQDGELIRAIVTEIKSYYEISLVPHGADPFARKIDEESGKIVSPHIADRKYAFGKKDKYEWVKEGHQFIASDLYSQMSLSFNGTISNGDGKNTIPTPFKDNQVKEDPKSSNPNFHSMQTLNPVQLAAMLGLSSEQITPEAVLAQLQANHKELLILRDEVKELRETKAELNTKVTELKQSNDQLKLHASIGENHLNLLRTETERLYHLLNPENPDVVMLTLIAQSNYEGLRSLKAQFESSVDKKFQGVCRSCGSHDVTSASAFYAENPKNKAMLKNSDPSSPSTAARQMEQEAIESRVKNSKSNMFL